MGIFDLLNLLCGVSFFLFGMQLMGGALEKKAEGELRTALTAMTSSPWRGFLLGTVATALVQSSSAITVMLVGFVNSAILTLHQALYVIMGANIGTTITSWILSLTGLRGDAWYIQLFKPSTFVPVFAVWGIVLYLFTKNEKRKDTGLVLLGFATLMTGMQTMSASVSGLRNMPEFTQILTVFSNPLWGVVAGAVITAIIQSSSASVGILQALSATGAVTYGTAIPIIMGQNIGTCVTAMISAVGTSKAAKKTAVAHLYFNVGGTVVLLAAYCFVKKFFDLDYFNTLKIDEGGIAFVHTAFNILCTVIWLPFIRLLKKLMDSPAILLKKKT